MENTNVGITSSKT